MQSSKKLGLFGSLGLRWKTFALNRKLQRAHKIPVASQKAKLLLEVEKKAEVLSALPEAGEAQKTLFSLSRELAAVHLENTAAASFVAILTTKPSDNVEAFPLIEAMGNHTALARFAGERPEYADRALTLVDRFGDFLYNFDRTDYQKNPNDMKFSLVFFQAIQTALETDSSDASGKTISPDNPLVVYAKNKVEMLEKHGAYGAPATL